MHRSRYSTYSSTTTSFSSSSSYSSYDNYKKRNAFSPPRNKYSSKRNFYDHVASIESDSTSISNGNDSAEFGGFLKSKSGKKIESSSDYRPSHSSNLNQASDPSQVSKEGDLIISKNFIARGKCERLNCKYDHSEIQFSSLDLIQSLQSKVKEAIDSACLPGKVEVLLIYECYHVSNFFFHFQPSHKDTPDTYRKWIMFMLELLSTENTRFFNHLQKMNSTCLRIFQTLFSAEYSAFARSNVSRSRYSFQYCCLPLLFLLTHSDLESSPLRELTNPIYSIFAHHLIHFFLTYLGCSMELLKLHSLEDLHFPSLKALEKDKGCFVPFSFAQVYYPFVRFLGILMNRFPELMRSKDMQQLIQTLEKELMQWREKVALKNVFHQTIESEYAVLVVEKAFQPIKEGSHEIIDITARLLAKQNKEKENQANLFHPSTSSTSYPYVDLWPDGPLEPPKGVHDNDFENYKLIRIIPTMQEILSNQLPTLPGNQLQSPYAHWLEPSPLRLLDTHFRLVRHDMLASIQLGLKCLLTNLSSIQVSKRFKHPFGYQQVDLMVYTDLKFHQIEFDHHYGCCYSVWYVSFYFIFFLYI